MSLISIETLRSSSRPRLPAWFHVEARTGPDYLDMKQILDRLELHTICEEARCPNRWECWNARTATFLILGDVCTRRCHYCSVETGRPAAIDQDEPRRIADAVQALRLRHAVITSVNRDELADGGAAIFAETIRLTRQVNPDCTIEVLIPDLEGNTAALDVICQAQPDVLNHNIETVPRLFPTLRPQGKYHRSLEVVAHAARAGLRTKSGLIVGMGETAEEIRLVLHDLRQAGCDIVTIGQYLPPTAQHLPVTHFYQPADFTAFKTEALAMGFIHAESGPLIRSSYHAGRHASR